MTSIKRSLAAAGAAALLSVALTACGGDDTDDTDATGASADASTEAAPETSTDASAGGAAVDEFCAASRDSLEELGASLQSGAGAEAAWQKAADTMEDAGPPSDIPDEAREGFEATVDLLRDLDPEHLTTAMEDAMAAASPEEAEKVLNDAFGLSKDDVEKFDALGTYVESTC